MKLRSKRILSALLAFVFVVSLCANGIVPSVSAADETTQATNVALGKTVTFGYGSESASGDANYGVSAINAGLAVLTDGVNDSTNWWVNNGNPYIALKNSVVTGPYSFTVDLGTDYIMEGFSVYSYSRTDWGITPVDAVTYSVSENGTTWQNMGTVELADATVNTLADPRYEGSYVDIYEFSLDVDSEIARYVKVEFVTNEKGLVGIGEIEVYGTEAPANISQGKSVTWTYGESITDDVNWGASAVEKGLSVLTDGENSFPNWWVNNGNPNIALKAAYVSGPYSFTVDLASLSSVSYVSAYFYSRSNWSVDTPNSVTFLISSDGKTWTEAGTVLSSEAVATTIDDDRNPSDQKPTIYKFSLNVENRDARYVKVSFGTNAIYSVAIQEIEVLGVCKELKNLALGRLANTNYYTYEVTGGGTGYEASGTTKSDGTRYTVSEVENVSLSRLTDGTIINQSAVTYPSGWSSSAWNNTSSIMGKYMQIYRNDSRIITLDLGAVRNISELTMHFGAAESLGFYMPTNVTYYLSEDGENYYEIADVWNYEAVSDTNDSNISTTSSYTVPRHAYYSTGNINYNARYVKIIFPVNVYIITDELLVYGYESLSGSASDLTACEKYDPLEKYVGHYANTAQSGGVKNEFMAYSGWYVDSNGDVFNTYKTVDEYMSSITYVDTNGVPQDWLFDDMTVMGHYYTSSGTFNSYKAGYTSGKYYADQDDWYEWLCYAFGKDTSGNDLSYDGASTINLEALEEAARIAKETLNDPDYKVGVKLVLFPAVEYQDNWGTLDGKAIDFTIDGAGSQEAALANREAAYQWYVDTAVEMWENAGFEHLELTGFYYYEETIHESTDRIAKAATQALTDIVHAHATPDTNTKAAFDSEQGGHLYIYQLPYYQSEGYWNWAEYGFDYALMQPNYSFYDMYTLTQLEECGNLCKYYGLGMQMEFGGTASQTYMDKFENYLTYGEEFGYKNAILSWYMSTWGCYSMSKGTSSARYLYDMVYEFVKEQNAALDALVCKHTEHDTDGICTSCGESVEHTYAEGICSVCGNVLTDSELRISRATLQLENDISIVFKAAASVVDGSYSNCYVEVIQELEDGETESQTIEGVLSSDGQFYEFKYTGVNAKEVGDSLDVTIYAYNAKNQLVTGKVLEDYSVMKYCKSQLSKTDEQLAAIGMSTEQQCAFRTLLVDLVNYASEAQKYFGYKTEALVSDQLTETQKTYASDDSVLDSLENITKVSYVQIEDPTATWKSAGLNLLSKTTVRLQFEYSGDINNVTMEAKVNGKAVDVVTEFESLGNNLYYVYFDEMTACQFSVPLDFTITENGVAISNTLRYSVESYVFTCKDSATVGAVMSSMMKYGKAALAYKIAE